MKWFLTVIALASIVGFVAASCGPQRDFCPSTNPDPTDLNCHGNIDGSGGMGGQDPGLCDGGMRFVCNGVTQCTPCNSN